MVKIFHRHPRICTVTCLAMCVVLGHIASVDQGLFMDDHVHYQSLRDSDWSFQSSVTSSKLGVLGEVLEVWGRGEQELNFFRPIAFWILKAEYSVTGFHPMPMHAFSLVWHFLASMLLVGLAKRCFGSDGPAAIAGMLFALHPAQVAATYWIACQTELMVTVFLLASFLCYGRFSRWPFPLFARSARWDPSVPVSSPDYRWLAAAMVFFVLALGCRETGVLFAPLIFLTDLIVHPRRLRWLAYGSIAVIAVCYLTIRTTAMEGFPVPEPPYLMTPTQPGFWAYVAEKFMLYCLGLFAYLPITPAVALDHLRGSIWQFYMPFAGIVLGWLLLLWSLRGRRGALIPFVWLIVTLLPMLPIGPSPHHLYLPSVGMILILMAAFSVGANWLQTHAVPIPRSRTVGMNVIISLHLIGFLLGSWGIGWLYCATFAIEDTVVDQVVASRRPIRSGDHLFFLNLPLGAWYVVPAYENEKGLHDLHGHALSLAPGLLPIENRSRLTQLDDHTLRVEAVGAEYFSGPEGAMTLQMLNLPRTIDAITTVEADLYTVTLEPGENGARAMTFRFHRPLSDPAYHFFYGSAQQLAYAIEFRSGDSGSVASGGGLSP